MGEIVERIKTMEEEDMPSWLIKKELQFDRIEKDLKEFAHWLLHEE